MQLRKLDILSFTKEGFTAELFFWILLDRIGAAFIASILSTFSA